MRPKSNPFHCKVQHRKKSTASGNGQTQVPIPVLLPTCHVIWVKYVTWVCFLSNSGHLCTYGILQTNADGLHKAAVLGIQNINLTTKHPKEHSGQPPTQWRQRSEPSPSSLQCRGGQKPLRSNAFQGGKQSIEEHSPLGAEPMTQAQRELLHQDQPSDFASRPCLFKSDNSSLLLFSVGPKNLTFAADDFSGIGCRDSTSRAERCRARMISRNICNEKE